ncbi:hypothetical protein IFM89_015679 [Coptis chinensis]|uniref:RNase H type-1 domain-containing protein n=1 Tax=Coptis chinensis TaxID=261450 RepID=A0A835LIQ1_9MAGN|nr:hypothetical protein IFM89_015679 [Coptis chinensis]
MYADDLLLFGKCDLQQAHTLNDVIDKYCEFSGQHVNCSKSQFIHNKHLPRLFKNALSRILKVPATTQFPNYLGVPSLLGRSKIDKFQPLIERLQSRLAGWKAATLSKGGKLTLAQSVLSALPTYLMACTLILAGKKAWQLMEPNSIWASNVKARYFPASSFMQARLPSTASPCLKNIWKMKPILSHGLIWKVGDGLSIDAWKDRWIPSLDSNFILPPRPPECMYERVADFINPQTRQWNWAVVLAVWPSVPYILAMPFCTGDLAAIATTCLGSVPIPYATSLMAETFAIRIALRLASQLRIPLIVVEMDSSFLCDLLNHQNSQVPWEIKEIVEDIWELISGVPQTLIQHCYPMDKAPPASAFDVSVVDTPPKSTNEPTTSVKVFEVPFSQFGYV